MTTTAAIEAYTAEQNAKTEARDVEILGTVKSNLFLAGFSTGVAFFFAEVENGLFTREMFVTEFNALMINTLFVALIIFLFFRCVGSMLNFCDSLTASKFLRFVMRGTVLVAVYVGVQALVL